MPQLDIIRFKFSTPLHISNERADYASGAAILHSDAIASAIFFAWNQMGFPEWIPLSENDDAGFYLSSLFPFTTAEDTFCYFFPKPFSPKRIAVSEINDTALRKKMKKIAWVDWPVFQAMLSGTETIPRPENMLDEYWSSLAINPKTRNKEVVDANKFIDSHVVPRSKVSRTGDEDTTIFYIERFYFKKQAGLYLLASFSSNEVKERVVAAIKFLGDEGIGTDRNIGNGKFVPEFGDVLEIPSVSNAGYAINLGLFCPESREQLDEMITDPKVGYDIIKRGGWLSEPYNNLRKKSIYMFKEGSCFKITGKQTINGLFIGGKMADIKPTETSPAIEHPVWRNGKTIFIPVEL